MTTISVKELSESLPKLTEPEIDEGLYSRQIYVLGKDGMKNLASKNILISGLGGLGIEVAKNVILGGVQSVTLQETEMTSWSDLSSQYYLTEGDIGSNRVEASMADLKGLNPHVKINTLLEPITIKYLEGHKFQTVVLTEPSRMKNLYELSDFCHDKGIALILCETKGLFARVFCDFGENFKIVDETGEDPEPARVIDISKNLQGIVTLPPDANHKFRVGSSVVFSGVEGMTELNLVGPVAVTGVISPNGFKIGDTTGYSAYTKSGIVRLVKVPKTVKHHKLSESVKQPEILVIDYAKAENPSKTHLAFLALEKFFTDAKRYPNQQDESDYNNFMTIAENLKQQYDLKVLDDGDFFRMFLNGIEGNLAPINAFIGGFVAQEVMKSCTGKFCPLKQWMFFDAVECLFPNNSPSPPIQNRSSRYVGQETVFGSEFQKKLNKMKIFVVGSGAIGCELLKNFAMMGVGTHSDSNKGSGEIVVTDMDIIERSNLNRQFLFRPSDIGKSKSVAAAAAIRKMNSNVVVTPHENQIGAEKEHIYDENFFMSIDLVANALDNVETRMYVDQKCVEYRRPLLESGTLGTKGNFEIILPNLTKSYRCTSNPPTLEIPMCTLKYFPYLIHHTIQWARDMFEGVFSKDPNHFNDFLKNNGPLNLSSFTQNIPSSELPQVLQSLKSVLKSKPSNFSSCVHWARNFWEELYNHEIQQLLHSFPPDFMTSLGQPFWSGKKRCPTPMVFNSTDANCVEFVYSAANLLAEVFGLEQIRDKSVVIAELDNVIIKQGFQPTEGKYIPADDESSTEVLLDESELTELTAEVETLLTANRPYLQHGIPIKPLEFEKDDDKNFHIAFITAASNCRAINYGMEPTDQLQTKLIAGHIIPAIATTTSVVAGLVSLELYKICAGHLELSKYKNGYLNLAMPNIQLVRPSKPRNKKYMERSWNVWDRIDILETDAPTLGEFLEIMKIRHGLNITILSQGNFIMYNSFMADDYDEDLPKTFRQIIEATSDKKIEEHVRRIVLEFRYEGMEDEDCVPPVHYKLF